MREICASGSVEGDMSNRDPTPTRTESDATRGITAEQNIRGFRPMSAAMSACRNWKLCPCLLALDRGWVTSYSDVTRLGKGCDHPHKAGLTLPRTVLPRLDAPPGCTIRRGKLYE